MKSKHQENDKLEKVFTSGSCLQVVLPLNTLLSSIFKDLLRQKLHTILRELKIMSLPVLNIVLSLPSFFFFLNQALVSFIKEKYCMIYFSLVCSGRLLMIPESPGPMTGSVHTL